MDALARVIVASLFIYGILLIKWGAVDRLRILSPARDRIHMRDLLWLEAVTLGRIANEVKPKRELLWGTVPIPKGLKDET